MSMKDPQFYIKQYFLKNWYIWFGIVFRLMDNSMDVHFL